jgi:hypothetical protein
MSMAAWYSEAERGFNVTRVRGNVPRCLDAVLAGLLRSPPVRASSCGPFCGPTSLKRFATDAATAIMRGSLRRDSDHNPRERYYRIADSKSRERLRVVVRLTPIYLLHRSPLIRQTLRTDMRVSCMLRTPQSRSLLALHLQLSPGRRLSPDHSRQRAT